MDSIVIPPEQDEENSPITSGLIKLYVEAATFVQFYLINLIFILILSKYFEWSRGSKGSVRMDLIKIQFSCIKTPAATRQASV